MSTIIRLPQVMATTGLAKSTIYKKIGAQEFPEQIKLTSTSVGWIAEEVDRWIDKQIAESRSPSERGCRAKTL